MQKTFPNEKKNVNLHALRIKKHKGFIPASINHSIPAVAFCMSLRDV